MERKSKKPAKKTADSDNEDGKGGRPEFEPTDEDRKLVESLSQCGITQEEIARMVQGGIDAKTLRKHFRDELDLSKIKIKARIAQSLMQRALGAAAETDDDGNVIKAEVKPDLGAQIFYLKTQAGWKETSVHEHGGFDGESAIQHEVVTTIVDPANAD